MFCKFVIIMNLKIWTWQDNVGIDVIFFVFNYRAFHFRSLGSVIFPVTADAVETIGDARYVFDSIFPILPEKLLYVVLMKTSSFASTPMCAPQHAPHDV